MTNFEPAEFEEIWLLVEEFISQNYNVGRGKKSEVTGKDALFMLMTVLKYGGQWDMLARIFLMKGPTFERLITRFARLVSEQLYKIFVVDLTGPISMRTLRETNSTFREFPEALYAVDVTFQQSFRPSGSINEGKIFFSGKHKLYGLKVEVSVLPNGLAMSCSDHFPGSISDLEIIQRRQDWHKRRSRKKGDDNELTENGLFYNIYKKRWALLADEGHQGFGIFLRAILPERKPPRGVLSISEEAFIRRIARDRSIVENYFGRLCTLWTLLSAKWRWNHSIYDDFFKLGVALTNAHIKNFPLRAEDQEMSNRMKNRLRHIAHQAQQRRTAALQRYRNRRRERLDSQFRRVQFRNSDDSNAQ